MKAKVEKRLKEIAAGGEIPAVPERHPPLAVAPFNEKIAKAYQKRWSQYLQAPPVQTNSIGMKLASFRRASSTWARRRN